MAQNREELMEGVRKAYEAYPRESLYHIWAHLFDCYQEILKCNGGNQYNRGGEPELACNAAENS